MKPGYNSLVLLLLVVGCSKETHSAEGTEQARPATAAVGSARERGLAQPAATPGASEPGSGGTPPGLIEVSGEQLLLAVEELGGKGTLVNAWASWCGPCRHELPTLLGLEDKLRQRGVQLLLVSVDEPEARPQAIEFLKAHDAPLPSFVAQRPLGAFKAALNPRWPGMLPATFLYDAHGKLHYFWGGPVYEDELLEVLDQFQAGTLVDGEARFGLAPGKVER